jgi:phosphopantetheinyl transferase
MERHTPRVSNADRARATAFSDPVIRDEWLATHIALRVLIERAAGPQWRGATFTRSVRGKPQLDGASVAFSLSHAPGLALIGLAHEGSIGVDVERTRPVRIGAARRARIEEAGAALNAAELPSDGESRFLQAWVRLEAYAKADGCGVGRLLTRLGILGTGATARAEQPCGRETAELMLRDPQSPRWVRDVPLGSGRFAAVALSVSAVPTEALWLPASPEGLQTLLA